PGQLGCDELRGGRMACQKIDDLNTVVHAAERDPPPQHDFLARIVQAWLETKLGIAARPQKRPAGKAARDFTHVLLRVAAIDAKSMKFHQLASVIFIEPAAARV